ncbi:hypothetical protein [Mucilaginibacter hurinus]|uniref:hypothetical protein n=1 Tax=Mucilaginibacter hurinus TaxID=2201324 RepID=UPI0013145B51|nr:hypothetical protein [Mucilaginibacter hurinus]
MSKAEKEILKPATIIVNMSEEDRLRRDMYRPDMEKFRLFTKMLRTNVLLKKVIITYK